MNMNLRKLCVLAIGVLQAGAAFAQAPTCEPEKLATKYPGLKDRTIKIGADPQTPPYVMRDASDFNKVIGFDADLARAVLDCVGAKYEFVLGGWSGLLPAVNSGQIDVMWDNLYYKPERAKTVDFAVYMKAGTAAMVAAGNPKKVSNIEEMCGVTVSYAVGSAEEKIVQDHDAKCTSANKSPINKMPFQDLAAGMRLIEHARTDLLLWDLGFIDATVAKNKGKYTRAFAILGTFNIGAAIKKGDDDLRNAIADGLRAVQARGGQKAIFEKYGMDPSLEVPGEAKTN
ncbi:MAG: polar amino acid transport system substrate-binding protein [Variibacter sp.]|jgi:polar amino acid transport system substrate-binding protein|nr:polar amino acid transport system substrate-binding protein [Variibacter sp.]